MFTIDEQAIIQHYNIIQIYIIDCNVYYIDPIQNIILWIVPNKNVSLLKQCCDGIYTNIVVQGFVLLVNNNCIIDTIDMSYYSGKI